MAIKIPLKHTLKVKTTYFEFSKIWSGNFLRWFCIMHFYISLAVGISVSFILILILTTISVLVYCKKTKDDNKRFSVDQNPTYGETCYDYQTNDGGEVGYSDENYL